MAGLPNQNIPEKRKNESFHREMVEALISRSINSTYASEYSLIDELYKYYDRASDPEDFAYMMDAGDGTTLPAQWQPINKIRQKVRVLLGELDQRGYDFRVDAINKDAKVRKLEAKEEARVAMRINPVLEQIDKKYGFSSPNNEYVPEDEEELDEYFDKNYKEEAELILYFALKFLDKRNSWKSIRRELFRDMLIAGRCFVKNEIVNGIPKAVRLDPRYVIFDKYSEGDHLKDSTYWGCVRYMGLAEAASRYNMSADELKTSYANYKEFLRVADAKSGGHQRNFNFGGFDSLDHKCTNLRWFQEDAKGLRVLVIEAYWKDYQNYKHKIETDSYGGEHIKKIGPDSQDREGVVSKKIEIWRQGTLVGGQHLKEWGVMPNMPRNNESLAETEAPIVGVIPDFVNGTGVSVVEQLKGLQNLKDVLTYNIQLSIARAGAKGFVYDVAQCPPDWDVHTVIKYLKTVGVAFINSKENGTPSTFNQFQSIDLTLSESVGRYIELSRWVDSEMDAVSGINEARQGVVQGSSQAVGVTQSALLQSSLATAPLFNLFDEFQTRVWNYQARLVKIAFPKAPERFAPIIGDTGVDFLTNDIDLELNDYAVFVDVTPALLDDLNRFQGIIMAAMQSGSLTFQEAMILLMEKDVMAGIRRYQKIMQKKEAQAKIDQQEQMMMEQQAQMEAQRQMSEYNMMTADRAAQNAQATQGIKNQGALQELLLKQRADLQKLKIETIAGK